jgi:hypothetical protein
MRMAKASPAEMEKMVVSLDRRMRCEAYEEATLLTDADGMYICMYVCIYIYMYIYIYIYI